MVAQRLSDTRPPPTAQSGQNGIAQTGQSLWGVPFGYLASILAERLIAHIVDTILDHPVFAP
jgi:hypothetical protein